MFREINLIRLTGNNGSHGKSVSQDESIVGIKNLFRFLSFLGRYYSQEDIIVPPFDITEIPDGNAQKESLETIQLLEEQLNKRREIDQVKREALEEQAAKIELLQKQLNEERRTNTERRQEIDKVVDVEKEIPVLVSEAVTRKLYIDVLLKDA